MISPCLRRLWKNCRIEPHPQRWESTTSTTAPIPLAMSDNTLNMSFYLTRSYKVANHAILTFWVGLKGTLWTFKRFGVDMSETMMADMWQRLEYLLTNVTGVQWNISICSRCSRYGIRIQRLQIADSILESYFYYTILTRQCWKCQGTIDYTGVKKLK